MAFKDSIYCFKYHSFPFYIITIAVAASRLIYDLYNPMKEVLKMKKILMISICIFLLIAITGCKHSSAAQISSVQEIENPKNSPDKNSLKFQRNDSTNNAVPPDEKDKALIEDENHYEYYLSEDNSEYVFIGGTDILCGISSPEFKNPHFSKGAELNEDEIKAIVKEYLIKQVPEFDKYTFLSVDHQIYLGFYIIEYSYFLNNIQTDDIIRTIIYTDGTIGTYFMPNRGKYNNVSLEQSKLDKAINEAKKKTDGTDWDIKQTIKKVGADLYLVFECFGEKDQMYFSVLIES